MPTQRQHEKLWKHVNAAWHKYARSLRNVATHISDLILSFGVIDLENFPALNYMLKRYSETIEPWAKIVAEKMALDVARRDLAAWNQLSKTLSTGINREIRHAPIGKVVQEIMDRQVTLIRSLPLHAAQRVHTLVLEGLESGTRAAEIQTEIMKTGLVTKSRAMVIARTETSRAATALTEARARFVGSTHYIWRTVKDARVRPDHVILEGTIQSWDNPPVADRKANIRAHAGCIYKCRCYPQVIVPEVESYPMYPKRKFFAEAA